MNRMESRESGKFRPGLSGNPAGRPKGSVSGRTKALTALDHLMGEDESLELIRRALEDALRNKPLWFFVNIIMPLLPKEAVARVESGSCVVEWRSLLDDCGDDEKDRGRVEEVCS